MVDSAGLVRQLSEKDLQFGQNVICLRNKIGITQERLAEKVEISSRYFQSIEAGKRWPSLGGVVEVEELA